MNPLKIGNLTIGEGKPKICIPLVGRTLEELLAQAEEVNRLPADLVEWRVDYFKYWKKINEVRKTVEMLGKILHVPLLFTFRTAGEGGESAIGKKQYENLLSVAAKWEEIKLIDVEIFFDTQTVKKVIENVHAAGKYVLASNHDFEKTPPKDEMIDRLKYMESRGADISKIAVMPKDKTDVVMLLAATAEMYTKYAKGPIVTMSMSREGIVSRILGESTGSAITFGTAGQASAPGQIPAEKMAEVLEVLHSLDRRTEG